VPPQAGSASNHSDKDKKVNPGELMILWADGHETHHLAPGFAGNVPMCVMQGRDDRRSNHLPIHIPDALEFRKIELVGQYALQFEWSDGHRTGIYSFEYLRELCPCPVCKKQ